MKKISKILKIFENLILDQRLFQKIDGCLLFSDRHYLFRYIISLSKLSMTDVKNI
jgi:hypothetical protein